MTKKALAYASAFLFACVIYLLVAWPAVDGGFVFDDYPNLSSLSDLGTRGFWSVVLEGVASSLGRPLSMLTFALQSHSWPEDPGAFKIVNLFLHVFNGWLVVFFSYQIFCISVPNKQLAVLLSLFSAIVWLFHAMHASTVFYVVQRMSMLSAAFVLMGAGYWAFVVRSALEGKNQQDYFFYGSFLVIPVCFILGILSKENAILLGLFLATLYSLVIDKQDKLSSRFKLFWLLVSLVPTLGLVLYLVISERYLSGYSARTFTPDERLLTEARILWDYVFNILWPTPAALNLFNDSYPVSHGLLDPYQTLTSIFGWIVLLVSAIAMRKVQPLVLFGVLWFLAGHMLESTILGLELYFEHRNYVSQLGIIWLVLGLVASTVEKTNAGNTENRKARLAALMVLALGWAGWQVNVLLREVKAWSSPQEITMAGLNDRPDSLRAWQFAAAYFGNVKDYPRTAMMLYEIEKRWPGFAGTTAQQILLNCHDPNVKLPVTETILERFKTAKMDRGAVPSLFEVYKLKSAGGCRHLEWETLHQYLEAIASNRWFYNQLENTVTIIAYSYMAENNLVGAARAMETKLQKRPTIGFLLLKIRVLLAVGEVDAAEMTLQKLKSNYPLDSKQYLIHESKIQEIENLIQRAIN